MIYFLLILIPWIIYMFLKTKKALHMLQQNRYNRGNRYFRWIIKEKKKLNSDDLINYLLIIIVIISKFFNKYILVSSFFIITIILVINYTNIENRRDKKLGLAFTSRIKRLLVTYLLLTGISFGILIINFNSNNLYIYLMILTLFNILIDFIMIIVNRINYPIERYVYYSFKRKATKKLKSINNLQIIGITGSYGKTSSKNILNDILKIKYNTLPSPKNFNTPFGLMITINEHMTKFDEVFIAEMGAMRKGEIKELCDLVKPKYGILTKIGTAHLETFGTEETIMKEKFELIECLPNDGIGILNCDDEKQVNYSLKNNCKIIWIGINNKEHADIWASSIKNDCDGSTFKVTFKKDKKSYDFKTKLLGHANIYNILAGIALGYELGLSVEELQKAVAHVKQVEHRLELKKGSKLHIIDDSYNSNPDGAQMALEVLEKMPGAKYIITPGMIELGELQEELNMCFGNQIAKVCDRVILIGEKQTKPIYEGLINSGYNKKNIHIAKTFKEGFAYTQGLVTDESYILIENDLPDSYNE